MIKLIINNDKNDKTENIIHIRNLNQTLNHG